mmetsp:Transcript_110563/g.165512  ORF Transcript_110563/g.165512 Transcript_110563/m.165512 type:complete len:236 (-) Transcript_110563:191-898(-)|eukprot:CAMPEP_0117046382 /NCGR_PEP_ID=MMETSP0472-20121206/32073_1 /TAXON_ID=693140 ORGANISM="Tiarina fusus, Strain LIS" /NCGR_SAMPLE_ID=MMETSP0472 /ASSEMBLY_ACC=CAM_ASM_000603 /LENGTH=235 /DNA_ID=CAMNT_0004758717 /DNA_START=48 /DNA_END=755 /DNA_ORIENTATION=+
MGARQSDLSLKSIPEDWPWVWALRDGSILDWKHAMQSDDEIQAQAKRQQKLPVQIAGTLFLGNAASIQNVTLLEALEITAVLNMAGPIALPSNTIKALRSRGIEYKRIDAEDEYEYPLLENHLQEAMAFIKSATKGKGKCVVHCVAGMNRSGLIVAAYHMLTTQTPVLETVKHIRKHRGNVALQNEGFQEQLVALARQENLLGAMPGTEESFIKKLPPADWREERKKRPNPLDRF